MTRTLLATTLAVTFMAFVHAQSLGDLAKKNEEDRIKEKPATADKIPAKTYSNKDLDSRPAPDSGSSAAGSSASTVREVPLVLDSWDYSFKPGSRGNDYYTITIRVRNVGTKAIKLVEGGLNFSDLLGEFLYGAKYPPDVYVAAGATDFSVGDYPINQFINREVRLRDLKKADVTATLVVRRVVFTDNTIWSSR